LKVFAWDKGKRVHIKKGLKSGHLIRSQPLGDLYAHLEMKKKERKKKKTLVELVGNQSLFVC